MLMNNLAPEVAERPDDLVVCGGTSTAARNRESFWAIVSTLQGLDDETLPVAVRQARRGVSRPLGAEDPHRQLPRRGSESVHGHAAHVLGLRDVGRLAVGYRADVLLLDVPATGITSPTTSAGTALQRG